MMVFLRRVLLALVLGSMLALSGVGRPILGTSFAQAQGNRAEDSAASLSDQDYVEWTNVANRAEAAIEANRASDSALNVLRNDLVDWRSRFAANQSANSAAASAVQAQLDTLGPKPADGEEEAQTIATQRQSLEDRLAEIQAPARKAELAHSQADALVRSIDGMLRARQTDALLKLGPAPIDPTKWPGAFSDLSSFVLSMVDDATTAWGSNTKRAIFQKNLVAFGIVFALALLLVLRGRIWFERLAFRLIDNDRSASRWLISFLVSLGEIVLPVLGLVALGNLLINSGITGAKFEALAAVVGHAGVQFFFARWLGNYIFPPSEKAGLPLELSVAQRREGRLDALMFGLLMGLNTLLDAAADAAEWGDATRYVLAFPILILMGIVLLRISRFMVLHARADSEDKSDDRSFRRQIVYLVGRVVGLLAVVGPALAAVGYFQVGTALVVQTLLSLMLIALLMVLQKLIEEVYVLVTKNRAGVNEALLPVLLSFAMALLSLPFFALIWGARSTDLLELWTEFQAGFSIGETHISPGDFLTFAIVFSIGYAFTRVIQGALKTTVLPKTRLDIGGQNAVVSGLGYVGIFLAALVAITTAGIDLSSLAIVAGALSVGVGFGLRTIVENFVSGIILLVERPISEGDWIEAGGQMGFVRNISVRSTRIETFARTDVIVPNADLISGVVTNWTRGNLIGRLIVKVGVAYGTDTRRVQSLLQEIAEAQPLVLLNPPPGVIFNGFGADSLDFEIRMILRDITQINVVQTEVYHQIAERFVAEGIEIPFAQRDVWLRNPEALLPRGAPVQKPTAPERSETAAAAPAARSSEDGHAPGFMRDTDTGAEGSDLTDGQGDGDGDR